jgi:hypothetical protein
MNITDAERKILTAVAQAMQIPKEFGSYEDDEYVPGADGLRDDVEKVLNRNDFYYANGVSKFVIVPEHMNYVLKTPLLGMWYEKWNDSEGEVEDWETAESEYSFQHFEYANDFGCDADADEDDYCENELIKYDNACDAGFGEFFAATDFLGHFNGNKFYIQEKVESLSSLCGEAYKKPSQEAVDTYDQHRSELGCSISGYWVTRAIEWYGLKRTLEFIKYIEQENIDQDLHSGNIGFTKAGKPVLLDWSGWRD